MEYKLFLIYIFLVCSVTMITRTLQKRLAVRRYSSLFITHSVPLATEPGISLIILTPMNILQ